MSASSAPVDEVPLIWTTKGNLPVAGLEYRYAWLDNEVETTFIEEYWLGTEMVKRSVHTRLKQAAEAIPEAASLG